MRAGHYAQALWELESEGRVDEQALRNVVQFAVKNGHTHLFPKILKLLGRIAAREERKRTIEVITAKEMSQEQVAQLLKKEPFSRAVSSEHKKVVRRIDHSLIGGAVVCAGGIRIDGSYKQALLELYQNIIGA